MGYVGGCRNVSEVWACACMQDWRATARSCPFDVALERQPLPTMGSRAWTLSSPRRRPVVIVVQSPGRPPHPHPVTGVKARPVAGQVSLVLKDKCALHSHPRLSGSFRPFESNVKRLILFTPQSVSNVFKLPVGTRLPALRNGLWSVPCSRDSRRTPTRDGSTPQGPSRPLGLQDFAALITDVLACFFCSVSCDRYPPPGLPCTVGWVTGS